MSSSKRPPDVDTSGATTFESGPSDAKIPDADRSEANTSQASKSDANTSAVNTSAAITDVQDINQETKQEPEAKARNRRLDIVIQLTKTPNKYHERNVALMNAWCQQMRSSLSASEQRTVDEYLEDYLEAPDEASGPSDAGSSGGGQT